jgi:serine/threonine protein kinase
MDIASGLNYLHSIGVVHGNLHLVNLNPIPHNLCCSVLRLLKENKLVTDSGGACITDVGVNTLAIRTIYKDFYPVPSAWAYKAHEELMNGLRDRRTDVFSFASTAYAVSVFPS